MAFKNCARDAVRLGVKEAGPQIVEPIMTVDVSAPEEFQGAVVGGLTRRRGTIVGSSTNEGYCNIVAEVPLEDMFGYSTELRSNTQVGVSRTESSS